MNRLSFSIEILHNCQIDLKQAILDPDIYSKDIISINAPLI